MHDWHWHIISYPRSGNHLARAIIEGYSGRPTVGCPGIAWRDRPIHMRPPNQKSQVICVDDHRPIGFKSHFVREFHAHDRTLCGQAGVLLITRDPLKAISSHVYRNVKGNNFARNRTICKQVWQSVESYLSLVHIYRSMADRPRLHVLFEDLTNPDTRVAAAERMLSAVGVDAAVCPDRLCEILNIAKNSQNSVGNYRFGLMDRIQTVVREHISYEEVLGLIASR